MSKNDVSESLISQRLRRLREEGEAAKKYWAPRPDPLPLPSSARERDPQYVQTLVEIEGVDSDGEITAFMSATIADANASPFEKIIHKNWIARLEDDEMTGMLRVKAGLRLRSLHAGAQVSPLKGQNYEGGGGGRGGVPAPVSDQTMDCIRKLAELKERVPAAAFTATVDVVCRDVWIWEGKKGGAVGKTVDQVLRGLDYIAAALGYMNLDAVRQRWPERQASAYAARPSAPAA